MRRVNSMDETPRRIRVVLVDDNPIFLSALRDFLLQAERFAVVGWAISARAGLAEIARTKPDLVLMTASMPQMTGIEASGLIVHKGGLPRVMLMASFGTADLHRHALHMGADAVVAKDDLHSELERLTAQWFGPTANERFKGQSKKRQGSGNE